MKSRLLIVVLLFSAILSCQSNYERDAQKVKDAILRYNQLLAEGYAKMNMNPLQEVATAEHATKLYYHMAALGEAKVRLESELKNIEFLNMKFNDSRNVTVSTRETWDFSHVNYNTQKIELQEKGFVYELTYELTKKDDRWLVKGVTAVERKSSVKKGNKEKEGQQSSQER